MAEWRVACHSPTRIDFTGIAMDEVRDRIEMQNQCADALRVLATIDLHALIQQDRGEALTMEGSDAVHGIQLLAVQAMGVRLHLIPIRRLNSVLRSAQEAVKIVTLATSEPAQPLFGPTTPQADQTPTLVGAYDAFFSAVTPILTLRGAQEQAKEIVEVAEATKKKLKEVEDAATDDIQKKKKEAESILEAMRKIAPSAGVTREAEHFATVATALGKAARDWLVTSSVLAAVLVIAAFLFALWLTPSPQEGVPQLVNRIAAKLLFVSVVSSGLLFSVRNYAAARHNQLINEHRATAMKTFTTFIAGASDEETKAAVLIATVKCIFGNQRTGFLRKEPDAPVSQLLEAMKLGTK
jgi:hypothetical protein